MGQANKRGTRSDRIEQAKALVDKVKPAKITCNHCKSDITDIQVLDSRGMNGISGAYAGICACGQTTLAMQGNPDAVADAMIAFQDTIGHEGVLGMQQIEGISKNETLFCINR